MFIHTDKDFTYALRVGCLSHAVFHHGFESRNGTDIQTALYK